MFTCESSYVIVDSCCWVGAQNRSVLYLFHRPSEQEVRKRHRQYMLKFHPDKAPAGKIDEYTETAARLNRAKEIILRAQGLSDDGDGSCR